MNIIKKIDKNKLSLPNAREYSVDTLGNKVNIGDYVLFNNADRGTNFKIGIVHGFTKKTTRIFSEGYPTYSTKENPNMVKIRKEDIPKERLEQFKDFEDILLLPKKMDMI